MENCLSKTIYFLDKMMRVRNLLSCLKSAQGWSGLKSNFIMREIYSVAKCIIYTLYILHAEFIYIYM